LELLLRGYNGSAALGGVQGGGSTDDGLALGGSGATRAAADLSDGVPVVGHYDVGGVWCGWWGCSKSFGDDASAVGLVGIAGGCCVWYGVEDGGCTSEKVEEQL